MKKTLYILMGAALVLASCEKVQEVKSLEIERTSGIHQAEAWSEFIQGTGTVNAIGDEAYYQNLRDWKKAAFDADGITTRSISYIFFADYGSMAFRFADIPDSVDVINLWGGCPKKGSLDYQEMKACQEIKGMKVVGCRITRILENARWGMEAQIPSFMKAYEAYKYDNMGKILQGKMTAQELESAALEAGNAALRADVQAHPGKGANSREAEGGPEWPEWCVYASQVLLDEIEQYGLDGYDLDYEPEGDPLSGTAFNTMVAYLSQFIGPKSGNEGTLLIIDRNSGAGDKDLAQLLDLPEIRFHRRREPRFPGRFRQQPRPGERLGPCADHRHRERGRHLFRGLPQPRADGAVPAFHLRPAVRPQGRFRLLPRPARLASGGRGRREGQEDALPAPYHGHPRPVPGRIL